MHFMHAEGRLGPGPTRYTCWHVWQFTKQPHAPVSSPAEKLFPVHTPDTEAVATGPAAPLTSSVPSASLPGESSPAFPLVEGAAPGGMQTRPNLPAPVGMPPVLIQTLVFTQRPSSKCCAFLHLEQLPTLLETATGTPVTGWWSQAKQSGPHAHDRLPTGVTPSTAIFRPTHANTAPAAGTACRRANLDRRPLLAPTPESSVSTLLGRLPSLPLPPAAVKAALVNAWRKWASACCCPAAKWIALVPSAS